VLVRVEERVSSWVKDNSGFGLALACKIAPSVAAAPNWAARRPGLADKALSHALAKVVEMFAGDALAAVAATDSGVDESVAALAEKAQAIVNATSNG
jgi:hypothetical protein